MKSYEPKFSVGSLFICSKCGKDFNQLENAEKLKSDLRLELKNLDDAHKKIRVMVSGCLGVCESGSQAFGYYPNQGSVELYVTSNQYQEAQAEILDLIKKKI